MAKLVVFDNGGRRKVELKNHNSLGRLPQNDIQILDQIVSKQHANVILDKSKGFVIQDLGSLNGCYVNRQRVFDTQALQDGDEITLGNTRIIFLNDDDKSATRQLVDVSIEQLQSQIHSKVQVTDRFVAEKEITDEKHLREDYEKLRINYELQRDLKPDAELDDILNKILERTFEFLNCDRGAILLADEKGNLHPRIHKKKNLSDKFILSSTLINLVQTEKTGVLSSDAQMDDRFKEARSMIMQGIRSSMAAPILYNEELIGVIIIDSLVAVNAYSEKDVQLLTSIGSQAARFIHNLRLSKKIREDALTRERFSRLMSPDLAEMVVSGALDVKKGGDNRIATVLFADIRGFTPMSENMTATEVLQMLNEYFEIMVEVAFKHEGTVDKFIGDEIMIIWGAPINHQDDAVRAVRAAVDMQKALAEFNAARREEGKKPIDIGIGINTGDLVAGYIGSSRTMSYSVIGDAVNTASRLCSAASPGQIVVSEATHGLLGGEFDSVRIDDVIAKGKSKPLKAFNVTGYKEASVSEQTSPSKAQI